MFHDTANAISESAKKQLAFLKHSPIAYLLSAILAGFLLGFGVILSAAVWVQNQHSPSIEWLSGAMVPLGLIMVIFTGVALFTGNIFIITLAAFKRQMRFREMLKIIGLVYLGNFLGAVLMALLFKATGQLTGELAAYYLQTFADKAQLPFTQLLTQAFLCNTLICAAVLAMFRTKSDLARFVIIFFFLLGFIATGFENSIANMTLGAIALMAPQATSTLSLGSYLYVILTTTLGNGLAGIILFAFPLWLFTRKPEDQRARRA